MPPKTVQWPPVAALAVENPSRAGEAEAGQALWIGHRVLTAAHAFMQMGENPRPTTVFLNDRDVSVVNFVSGDMNMARRAYRRPTARIDWFLEDWACLQVSAASADSGALSVEREKPRPGVTLYVVGHNWSDQGELQAWPVRVVAQRQLDGSITGELDARTTLVRLPRSSSYKTWSGSFVGYFDRREGTWKYVGQLVSGLGVTDEPGVHEYGLVVRPPDHILRWLTEGGEASFKDASPSSSGRAGTVP